MRFVPRWRFMTCLILAFTALMAWWLIWFLSSALFKADCGSYVEASIREGCEDRLGGAIAIGIYLIGSLWIIGALFLGTIWFFTGLSRGTCPACRDVVKKGDPQCRKCGHEVSRGGSPRISRTGMRSG